MKFVLHLAAAGQGQKVACWVSSRWPQAASTPPGSLGFNFKHRVHPHKHPHSAAVTLSEVGAVLFFTILVIPEHPSWLDPGWGCCLILVMDPELHWWEIKMKEPCWSTSQKNPQPQNIQRTDQFLIFFFSSFTSEELLCFYL